MKKFLPYLIAIAVVTTILFLPGKADACRWRLYDNFNRGYNPDKWDKNDSESAKIVFEDGKVCFYHMEGYEEESRWLWVKKYGDRIRGIRADITVLNPCDGDVRGRLAGSIAKVGANTAFGQLALQGGLEIPRAYGNLGVQDPDDPDFWEDLVWARFHQPLDIIGNTFTAKWTFSRYSNYYYLKGYGSIYYVYPKRIRIGGDRLRVGIGTRSTNGDGPCKVCFDNVYILK